MIKTAANNLIIEINNGVLSKGPTGEALYNGNILGINPNTCTNEKVAPWKDNQIKNGFYSSISVRLIDDLTINLYSEFTDFYTEEIVNIILSIRTSIMMAYEKNKYISKLKYLTFYDEITNLGNLNKFKKDFNEYEGEYTLCMINIKDFTSINANFGFEFGNKLLKQIGIELKKHIKKIDEVYRMYDDRFLLFLKANIWNIETIKNITNKIYNIFSNEGIEVNGQKVFLEINGSLVDSKNIKKEKALEGLIYAYVFAKNVVNKFVIYELWMSEEVQYRVHLKELLFKAIREKLFEVYFQPIVDIKSYEIVQFEALSRLKDNGKFVNMEKLMNIATELQIIPEITKIVVENVVKHLKIFKTANPDIGVSINVSKLDMESDFLEFFKNKVISNELNFKNFSLEITERESIEDTKLTQNFVKKLKEVGVKFEIDDFGVAYSNLKQSVSIDFDVLKIDKSFVDRIFEERIKIVVSTIILFAKMLNVKTIAEGVETKEQLDILKELGVDYIQGYYFAKPMPFEEAVEYLKKNM
ncbi:EAL domain-containing protein [Lebetimonas sp. JS032]|uniref:EAL domain-containing protein n=1 Tax=Lebetimonas sp. JS032 TaxID=990070 RepID=UPI00138AEB94|nr:GGDEF domain-containing phosphodiesterase [Lebetimonas sp. JS032]